LFFKKDKAMPKRKTGIDRIIKRAKFGTIEYIKKITAPVPASQPNCFKVSGPMTLSSISKNWGTLNCIS
jgi:hypothetical protein